MMMGTYPLCDALPQQNRNLADSKVNVPLCLVGNVRAKVLPDDAMPRSVILPLKLMLNVRRNRLLLSFRLECRDNEVSCVVLHLLRHVRIDIHIRALRHFLLLF